MSDFVTPWTSARQASLSITNFTTPSIISVLLGATYSLTVLKTV